MIEIIKDPETSLYISFALSLFRLLLSLSRFWKLRYINAGYVTPISGYKSLLKISFVCSFLPLVQTVIFMVSGSTKKK